MKLTTREYWLYEGAPTSPLIANMIFGQHEADLVEEYIRQEITYTRFVDDITISSPRKMEDQKLGSIIRQIYGMLLNKGLQPNRKKQKVYIGAGRGNVHAIITRRGRVHYEKSRRKQIKLEAYNLLKSAEETGRDTDEYRSRYNSILGKLSMMRRLHPQEAQREIDKLIEMAPLKGA
ncbi:retron reverse transcriptase [Isoalcanivorax pacificus W11-5]|uniref:Retron reverse transcriptase n=1 Tax=Isoalcanivorax pacificus W11-5 TaxID=391936 RepID=A0A0B4XRC2_9GAMM|nr:reverse transcriptase domain-containing protein [Isoalcanivorax pacificus]AJD49746.1 retron reverse transcriptase [Isoalcanivorax pacificus W11-5]